MPSVQLCTGRIGIKIIRYSPKLTSTKKAFLFYFNHTCMRKMFQKKQMSNKDNLFSIKRTDKSGKA